SDELADFLPGTYDAVKLYLSNYDDPQDLTRDIIDEVNQGALILNYVGHGGVELWATEEILDIQDIGLFGNEDRLPVVVSMDCLDGYYLHPNIYDSMAESFLTHTSGGAVAVWSPTGMGQSDGHALLDKGLFQAVFEDKNAILGSAIDQAKISLYQVGGDAYRDLIQTYTLFGDPALQLKLKVKSKGKKKKERMNFVFEPLF
ncbi:MAG: hypothetical protein KAJ10_10920, partial [Thermodesulfovibrionia bacterium]|nr:hypothetical protein [Thermodesulfovibrionia bacterium]